HSPSRPPAQRSLLLSSYKPTTPLPRLLSSPWHWTLPLRIAHSLPVGTPNAPTHTEPSRSSRRAPTACPASSADVVSLAPFQRTSPLTVPIQRVPSLATSSFIT